MSDWNKTVQKLWKDTEKEFEDLVGIAKEAVGVIDDSELTCLRSEVAALREALKDSMLMINRIKGNFAILDNAGYTPDGRMLKLSDVMEKARTALENSNSKPLSIADLVGLSDEEKHCRLQSAITDLEVRRGKENSNG